MELPTNPKTLKAIILRGIRSYLLEFGSATKAELSQKLGISFPTVSKFIAQMEKEGEVLQAGLDESSGGRKANRFAYNPDYRLGIAMFLDRAETQYRIINCMGDVKEQGVLGQILDEGVDCLVRHLEQFLTANPKIGFISIGIPGSVNNGRIIFLPEYRNFQYMDLKSHLEKRFGLPVVVENDMNAAVLGYHQKNQGQSKPSLVYLYFGKNGAGAGIMVNGELVRGKTFFSGEVSFVPQYDSQNFMLAMLKKNEFLESSIGGDVETDPIGRLIAALAAIINPHTVVFCDMEVSSEMLDQISEASSLYIPREHLPEFMISDWKQDYLHGLQTLGLECMVVNAGRLQEKEA